MENVIIVDTVLLNTYIQDLKRLSTKASEIDRNLWKLSYNINSIGIFNVLTPPQYSSIINQNIDFWAYVLSEFESVEKKLLKLDPLNYTPPKGIGDYLYEGAKVVYDFGKGVVISTCATVSAFKEAISYGGVLYKPWQIACKSCTAIASVITIVAAATTGVASYGASSPVSFVVIIFALNELTNSMNDLCNLIFEDGSEVGKHNVLKDQMNEGGEILGDVFFGNKETGKIMSDVFYGVGDGFESIAKIEKSFNYLVENNVNVKKATQGVNSYFKSDVKITWDSVLESGGKNPLEWLWKSGKESVDSGLDGNILSDENIGKNVYGLFKNVKTVTKSVLDFGK